MKIKKYLPIIFYILAFVVDFIVHEKAFRVREVFMVTPVRLCYVLSLGLLTYFSLKNIKQLIGKIGLLVILISISFLYILDFFQSR